MKTRIPPKQNQTTLEKLPAWVRDEFQCRVQRRFFLPPWAKSFAKRAKGAK